MTLSEELTWRGFVNQTTFKDIKALDGDPIAFYWGVDPSANSMTVGNLAAAMMVRHFIDHGHNAVLLVGGATGLIGDPDGKKQERDLKELDIIEANVAGISEQYRKLFAGKHFDIVNNYDWFKDVGYLWFLRNVGKHLSMTQLLDREFVQSRIGEGGAGISYAEFSYALIQGYDFLHLFREKGVTLQVCGADQWGNSLAGVEMIRKLEGGEAHVYSTPLVINKTTGVKFGKSEDGAVWLDESQTSVYKYYQFWLNIDDASVIDLLKIYTLLDKATIDELEKKTLENPSTREAQKVLAREATALIHGEARANAVEQVTNVLFGKASVRELDDSALDELSKEIPVSAPGSVIDILTSTGLVASSSEARRLLASGGISVNGEKIIEDVSVDATSLIKRGKNGFVLVR